MVFVFKATLINGMATSRDCVQLLCFVLLLQTKLVLDSQKYVAIFLQIFSSLGSRKNVALKLPIYRQAVVGQSSSICQAVFMQSSGSRVAFIKLCSLCTGEKN